MATTLIMGQPGAGKTSLAMERIMLPHFALEPKIFDPDSNELGEGILVTNVPLDRDKWVQRFGEEAVNERLITFPEFIRDEETGEERRPFTTWEDFEPLLELRDKHGRAPLFAIDEAHEVIPKGMRFPVDKETGRRTDTFPNKLLLLFTRQRHYLASFALVTQDPFSMAPDILKQAHSSIYVENAETKGRKHAYTLKIWNKAPPRNFATCTFDQCDDAQPSPRSYNPETQAFFVSNSKNNLGSAGRALEGRYRHSKPVWKRPAVLMMIPAVLALFYFVGNLLDMGESPANAAVPTPTAEGAKPLEPAASPEPADELAQVEVIDNLAAVELTSMVTEHQRNETQARTVLAAAWGKFQGKKGPLLVTHYPGTDQPYLSHLADYASYWGYALEPIHCGWKLSRSDNTRHLYNPTCLGLYHGKTPAADVSSGSSASGLEPALPGATAQPAAPPPPPPV
ncbi:zonular occludens toxin domain-containing protein [Qipengyuania gaetbuli]|uniref:zonular occludens toxin domain-containing protein n=1 Tax=Qipengyuania gaetbuli TaxID=266952 RepID=UPI001CFD6303|nr:zonular occludens toxin domain-containing protein [Qipengyuania gaetbuli]